MKFGMIPFLALAYRPFGSLLSQVVRVESTNISKKFPSPTNFLAASLSLSKGEMNAQKTMTEAPTITVCDHLCV